ncbi:hypothetical protein [Segnochrobactrum spirostomi]|uniref:Uncharacterized protein n=1 Tax=Segnochrobactrum spirostomi TaxID=2608987 RepID=A0A6A7Y6F2_9HYPH|nr:hypothetical protein [Segnochrobactrum spirostomi]MQT13661.1 hypothetical protein [Segnochrobactrum spirostomi]
MTDDERAAIEALPPLLREIAEVAGLTAARILGERYACLRKVVPEVRNVRDGHWLVEAVGMNAALAIARRMGGDTIEIPSMMINEGRRRRRRIRELAGAGATRVEIARKIGVHRRTVQRVLGRDAPGDGDQLPLFDSE